MHAKRDGGRGRAKTKTFKKPDKGKPRETDNLHKAHKKTKSGKVNDNYLKGGKQISPGKKKQGEAGKKAHRIVFGKLQLNGTSIVRNYQLDKKPREQKQGGQQLRHAVRFRTHLQKRKTKKPPLGKVAPPL